MAMDSLRGRMPALVVAVFSLVFCAAAQGAAGDPVVQGCTNAGTAQAPCTAATGQAGAFPEALSPDGRQLYVATGGGTPPGGGTAEEASLLVFDRNPATGALARRTSECFSSGGAGGACTTVSQLNNPQDVVVSPDGKSVYVSNYASQAISEFDRASDGSLTLKTECQGASGCTAANGMFYPGSMVLDRTGATLYVRTSGGVGYGTLLVFDRSASGALTQKVAAAGCLSETAAANCTTVAGISMDSSQMAVSPDNKNLYATGRNDFYYYYTSGCGFICFNSVPSSGTVAVFTRASDGTLSQDSGTAGGCISNNGASGGIQYSGPAPVRCVDGNDALDQAHAVAVSPDGSTVYVGAGNGVVAYARNASTGALTAASCRRNSGTGYASCSDTPALSTVYRLAVNDTRLIAASAGASGAVFFSRSSSTGALTPLPGKSACITQDGTSDACAQLTALGSWGSVTLADDRDIYLTGAQYGTVAHLYYDAAPVCDDTSVAVIKDQATRVPLACHDRDGDALTIAVTQQPFAGTLGAIDQDAGRAFYNPFAGFTGADSFKFTATGGGATSAPATASLDVQPPPAPPATGGSGPAGTAAPSGTGTPPPAGPSMTAGAPRVVGDTVSLTLSCAGPKACSGGISVTAVQKMLGAKVMSVSAAKAKLRRKPVSVGSVRFTIAAGKKRTLVVKLNRAGKQLLARFHKLPATLTAWMTDGSGKRKTIVAKKMVLKPAKRKTKKG